MQKEVVTIHEEIVEKYKPKLVRYIRFNKKYESEQKLKELLDTMNRAPRQKEVLMNLFMLAAQNKGDVTSVLLQHKSKTSASTIKTLIDKQILEEYFIQKDRLEYSGADVEPIKVLNEYQKNALNKIRESFKEHDVTLLHGVTSSGKTEIYVRLIEEALERGKQVLYMLPEIALTSQLIRRLQKYFGEKVSVYHSRFSSNERVEIWRNVLNREEKAQVVIGARSTLFLPFSDLGLVIVDEEHEPSFKQYNPAPRYHARDSAIVLAKQHQAWVILGSATPSIESYYNAQEGKYGLVVLKRRFGDILMPDIELVDINEKYRKKKMKGHFSDRLLEVMEETLKDNDQIILFQNRRGYSPVVECTTCGTSPQCPNCDVSLTFHQFKNELRCHYCGYRMPMPDSCTSCGNLKLDTKGFGTEQIEKELKDLFPDHVIARMDQDTTRKKHAYDKIIEALENKEVDIVVGTQMLAKGLDFRNVGLVGVMNADNLLNFPDFRAHERSFQLLQQVSGRAGRTDKQGKVLIQTFNPYHQIVQQVSTNDYEKMYEQQLEERYQYKYPPFFRTIKLSFKDRDQYKLKRASQWFGDALRQYFKENILGPEPPPIGRIRNLYISNILVKIPKEGSLVQSKEVIHGVLRSFHSIKEFSTVRIIIDVDQY